MLQVKTRKTEPNRIIKKMHSILDANYPIHPFNNGVTKNNVRYLMGNFLAMSQAFPYLQAGSQSQLIFHCIDKNIDISKDIEITSVVGNFLCWDETGGHYLLSKYGIKGLSRILDTEEHFHANLLRKDLANLFETEVTPNYSTTTGIYLRKLYHILASLDPIIRCAAMCAFEAHAERMITALWKSLASCFNIEKNSLMYFKAHVGGDDPAEAYHVQMTGHMIDRLIPKDKENEFLKEFDCAYRLNYSWCQELTIEEVAFQ